MFLSRTTRGNDRLKPFRVLRCDLNMDTSAYAAISHANSPVGIPKLESSVSINPLDSPITDVSFPLRGTKVAIVDRMLAHIKTAPRLFMDETRAPVLDSGAGKTKTGYLWALTRDDRGWGGNDPPAVVFNPT
jgi:hypothetical protein